MSHYLFREEQQMNQWWLHLILGVSELLILYGIYRQAVLGESFGDEPASTGTLIVVLLFTFCVHLFVTIILKLETKIDKFGIYYRFRPLINSFQFIEKKELSDCRVIKYNPVLDYGGWGFRLGLFSDKGRAYNIKGNMGLKLEWINGRKLLLGTQKPEELKKAIAEMKKNAEIE